MKDVTKVSGAHKILIAPSTKKELKRIAIDHDIGVGQLMGEILTSFVIAYEKDDYTGPESGQQD